MSIFGKGLARCATWLCTGAADFAFGGRPLPGRTSRAHPGRLPCPLRLEQLEERSLLSPTLLDPNLGVRAVATNMNSPTTMAFLGDNDFLVLEKTTGKIDRVSNGGIVPTQFDLGAGPIPNLPVNSNNDRGLLGVTLDPDFVHDHYVYLDWTESNTGRATSAVRAVDLLGHRVDRFIWNGSTSILTLDRNLIHLRAVEEDVGEDQPNADSYGGVLRFGPDGKLYVYMGDADRRGWLQNILEGHGPNGMDDQFGGPAPDDAHLTGVILRLNPDGSTPEDNPFVDVRNTLMGTLTGAEARSSPAGGAFAAFLNQAMDTLTVTGTFHGLRSPTLAGGAAIYFGSTAEDGPIILTLPDFPKGLASGEFRTTLTKANFVAHPEVGINTFADAVKAVLAGNTSFDIHTANSGDIRGQITQASGQVTDNVHKIFAYGFRNSFGMAFDPYTGRLWQSENGEGSFDHLTYIDAGQNAGWTQIMGPVARVPEWKAIEVNAVAANGRAFRDDWQRRFAPELLADTPAEALNRLVMLPGAHFRDPEFSWRYDVPPAAVGFMAGSALGPEYDGNLFVGSAQIPTIALEHGALMRFQFSSDRTEFALPDDPYIVGKVAENRAKNDGRGSKQLIFGTGFGLVTDIQTGPNGNLYVDSYLDGTIYEIYRRNSQPDALATRSAAGFTIGIIGGELTVNCDNTSHHTVTVDHVGSTTLINLIGFSDSWFKSIRINGGSAGTTVNLRATVKPISFFGSGLDTVNVGDTANSVQRIQAALTLEDDPSYTTLNINDSGDTVFRTVTLDSFQPAGETRFGRIAGLTPVEAPITYEYLDTEAVNVWTGAGGATVQMVALDSTSTFTTIIGDGRATNTIVGSAATNIFQITGTDAGILSSDLVLSRVVFSSFQNLTGGQVPSNGANFFLVGDNAGVSGNIVGGSGTNRLDYAAYTTAVTVDLSAGTATGVGGSVRNMQQVRGGAGDDNLTGNAAGITTFLASPGNDTVTGLAGSTNKLVSTVEDSTWSVTSRNAGTLAIGASTTTFTGTQNLSGTSIGFGANTFVFSDGIGVDGTVTGSGFGTNTLNYSAYSSSVIVDLLLGTATGVGGRVVNIQNVVGGSGGGASGAYNILVGNGGNVLIGGNGRRNLLIAGTSASTLIGGDDEDILIGGTTTYDRDLEALLGIMAVWTGPGSYTDRVNKLLSGSGVPLLDATTVTGNGGGNRMIGGPGLDLFYGSLTRDTTDWDPDNEFFIVL
jgi:glucose/arabinose dehydrogenase